MRRVLNNCDSFPGAGDKCSLAEHTEMVRKKFGAWGILESRDYSIPRGANSSAAAAAAVKLLTALRATGKSWVIKPCSLGAGEGILFVGPGGAPPEEMAPLVPAHGIIQRYLRTRCV